MVAELRRAAQTESYPRVILIHQGTVRQGDRFLDRRWPEAPAIADPERHIYAGFGRAKARLLELIGPSPLLSSFRALSRGHLPGIPIGDPTVRPGLFLVRSRILAISVSCRRI